MSIMLDSLDLQNKKFVCKLPMGRVDPYQLLHHAQGVLPGTGQKCARDGSNN